MKHTWIITSMILIVFTNGESRAETMEITDEMILSNIKLNFEEPLQLESNFKKLLIYESNGTIAEKTFSEIPQVVELEFVKDSFSSVENGALCTPPNLQVLILQSIGKFPVLTQSLLTNCEKLKSFRTGNVPMKADALQKLINLETLSICGLQVDHFTKEYLESLSNLREFSLAGCTIEQIDPASICLSPKLHTIKFGNNNFTKPLAKGVFKNCDTVEYLHYIFNEPTNQLEDGTFIGLKNLKAAIFTSLNYKTLTKGFLLGLSNVQEVHISLSRIESIAADTFDGFDNLKILHLSGIELQEIDSRSFSRLPNLVNLIMSNNKLTSIDNIGNARLGNLDVRKNSISNINTEILKQNLPNLKNLKIRFNPAVNDINKCYALAATLGGIEVD